MADVSSADATPHVRRRTSTTQGSGIGVGVDVGGGVMGFVGSRLRDTTSIGGLWSVRAALGTHTPLALELGYVGTASQINGQLGPAQATMLGRTFESSVRFTALP